MAPAPAATTTVRRPSATLKTLMRTFGRGLQPCARESLGKTAATVASSTARPVDIQRRRIDAPSPYGPPAAGLAYVSSRPARPVRRCDIERVNILLPGGI